jgi:translocation and assembly module TamB
LLVALLVLALLAALLIGAGAWLWHSDTALARLLPRVPGLSISGQQGRPTGGPFSVDRLQWQGAGLQVLVEDLAWDDAQWSWRPHGGSWAGVRLTQPRAALVRVRTTPDADGTSTPSGPGPPTDVRVGLEVQAPGLRIARLELDEQAPITDITADVHLGAAGGAEHRIENLSLRREGLALSGQAVIGTRDGLPVQARLSLAPAAPAAPAGPAALAASPAWQAEVQASGPLARLVVQARLQQAAGTDPGDGGRPGATATAQATLAPFAAWPLLALAAQADRLDLSSLAPGLPQTALSGRARMADRADPPATPATPGLQAPLVFDIDVDNAEPGPWDANRLPLRRLQVLLQGSPADPSTLVFDRFVAELAGTQPAGRIEGQGRLQQGSLRLELVLADVRPEHLATAAPPMRLGGTLGVAVDGLPGSPDPAAPRTLQARVQVDLNGRLARASTPPLRLQALASLTMPPDGTLSASLRDLRAGTGTGAITGASAPGGVATGEASAERQANGDWRLQTSGALARFDPGPWWPAARLGRGAQSLNLRWQADLTRLAGASAQAAGTAVVAPARAAGTTVPDDPWSQLRGSASLVIAESRLADMNWRGEASLQAAADALRLRADLRAGPNRFQVDGRLPHARGRAAVVPVFKLDLQAPALAALAPLAGLLPAPARAWWPRQGSLNAQASAQGAWPDLKSEGRLDARGLHSPQLSVGRAQARWNLAADSTRAPLLLDLQASDISSGVRRVDELAARLQGTAGEHRLSLRASSPVRPPAWADAVSGMTTQGGSSLQLQATGRWTPARSGAGVSAGGVWRARIEQLRAAPRSAPTSPWLAADDLLLTLTLAAGGQPSQAVLAPGRIAAFGGALNWQRAVWEAGREAGREVGRQAGAAAASRIELQAQLEPLSVAPLLARLQPQFGWRGDLALAGRIALTRAERLDAEIQIERSSGDLSLTVEGAARALEISDLRLGLVARDGHWQATQALVGRNVGVVAGLQTVQTTPQALWPEASAALEGGLSLIVPQLQVWAPWLPPGWRLGGELQAGASLSGTVGRPAYRGTVVGTGLSVRNLFEGIHLTQGTLDVVLEGTQSTVREAVFRDGAGEGWLRASGRVDFGAGLTADLRVATEQLRLLDRYDRRITTTGSAEIGLREQALRVRGSFTIDEGLVDATQADAARLSNDVIVLNRAPLRPAGDAAAGAAAGAYGPPATRAAATPADVELRIDLGRALRLRGRGLDTLLRGQLQISTPGGELAVNGVVRAEDGTYSAYGQNLRIERGNLIFSGEVATPTLDILALRGDIDERVGVVVSGTAVNPRVRLYSEPARDEFDTLTWLVLGRAPEGLGRDDTALLQRAALALLAGDSEGDGGFLQRLGLDELSVSRGGAGGANDTIISLGRQISRRVYVGYEQSLGSAGGTLQLIYRVANRITLRLRTGSENAIDVIWTWRWD